MQKRPQHSPFKTPGNKKYFLVLSMIAEIRPKSKPQTKANKQTKKKRSRNPGLQLRTDFHPWKTQAVTSLILANSNTDHHL